MASHDTAAAGGADHVLDMAELNRAEATACRRDAAA